MGEIVLEIQNRYLENQTTAEKKPFFFILTPNISINSFYVLFMEAIE